MVEGVGGVLGGFEPDNPFLDQAQDVAEVEVLVVSGIAGKVGAGELEQGASGPEPVFLQVDKGAGKLKEAFVEFVIGAIALAEPKLIQDNVSFVKELLVEALERAEVVGVEGLPLTARDEGGDFVAFLSDLAHGGRVRHRAGERNHVAAEVMRLKFGMQSFASLRLQLRASF